MCLQSPLKPVFKAQVSGFEPKIPPVCSTFNCLLLRHLAKTNKNSPVLEKNKSCQQLYVLTTYYARSIALCNIKLSSDMRIFPYSYFRSKIEHRAFSPFVASKGYYYNYCVILLFFFLNEARFCVSDLLLNTCQGHEANEQRLHDRPCGCFTFLLKHLLQNFANPRA